MSCMAQVFISYWIGIVSFSCWRILHTITNCEQSYSLSHLPALNAFKNIYTPPHPPHPTTVSYQILLQEEERWMKSSLGGLLFIQAPLTSTMTIVATIRCMNCHWGKLRVPTAKLKLAESSLEVCFQAKPLVTCQSPFLWCCYYLRVNFFVSQSSQQAWAARKYKMMKSLRRDTDIAVFVASECVPYFAAASGHTQIHPRPLGHTPTSMPSLPRPRPPAHSHLLAIHSVWHSPPYGCK